MQEHLRLSMSPEAFVEYKRLLEEAVTESPHHYSDAVALYPIIHYVRWHQCAKTQLKEMGIHTVGDLLQYTKTQLHAKRLSMRFLNKLGQILSRVGVHLRE